jgi:hypothetical protein
MEAMAVLIRYLNSGKDREIMCEMHVAQLLQTLSSLIAEHNNSSVVG